MVPGSRRSGRRRRARTASVAAAPARTGSRACAAQVLLQGFAGVVGVPVAAQCQVECGQRAPDPGNCGPDGQHDLLEVGAGGAGGGEHRYLITLVMMASGPSLRAWGAPPACRGDRRPAGTIPARAGSRLHHQRVSREEGEIPSISLTLAFYLNRRFMGRVGDARVRSPQARGAQREPHGQLPGRGPARAREARCGERAWQHRRGVKGLKRPLLTGDDDRTPVPRRVVAKVDSDEPPPAIQI